MHSLLLHAKSQGAVGSPQPGPVLYPPRGPAITGSNPPPRTPGSLAWKHNILAPGVELRRRVSGKRAGSVRVVSPPARTIRLLARSHSAKRSVQGCRAAV